MSLGNATMHAQSKQTYCTEDLVDENRGRLNSPGYPGFYPNNVNSTRIISFGNKRASVNFTILDFNVEEPSPDCYDYLKVILP